jgi:hypothetical protein
MKREQSGPFLSAVFVDYDNIYLSLRRKSEEAAKRFAKDAGHWIRQIEAGTLVTPTNGIAPRGQRRIVMNRCYGNSQPRRNASDNSTDMSSFPFVRHHFLRAGFELVDCPPLTGQLKNSADIRMVMDLRDYLVHETHFDEFVILSGDADFTPVLHRLRAHARRTVIYANDYTAAPYTAISDGEVREADLIALLLGGKASADPLHEIVSRPAQQALDAARRAIIEDVVAAVRQANQPVPLEVLADRAVRTIGHDQTIGTGWAGAGGFRELLAQSLPQGYRLSGEPPYVVIDLQRHLAPQPVQMPSPEPRGIPLATGPIHAQSFADADLRLEQRHELRQERIERAPMPALEAEVYARAAQPQAQPQMQPRQQPLAQTAQAPAPQPSQAMPLASQTARPSYQQPASTADPAPLQPKQPAARPDNTSSIQQSIARIHEACKAPPLAPPEYRALFELITQEINENGLIGAQTIHNIAQRAQERGIDIRRDDVRFVLEVVSEADPWFEQGASPTLFAGRFRNFVVARCRAQGLTLSADELDLVEAWFAGGTTPAQQPARQKQPAPSFAAEPPSRPAPQPRPAEAYWSGDEMRAHAASGAEQRPRQTPVHAEADETTDEDFPRIVRTRLRG